MKFFDKPWFSRSTIYEVSERVTVVQSGLSMTGRMFTLYVKVDEEDDCDETEDGWKEIGSTRTVVKDPKKWAMKMLRNRIKTAIEGVQRTRKEHDAWVESAFNINHAIQTIVEKSKED